mmetsp:Transcript_4895/g.13861  ORF Transcript_4895/g.13861 Transcript_4895/m.13861 type:complete len:221 (+) Transcript_4895:1755-2417(+)
MRLTKQCSVSSTYKSLSVRPRRTNKKKMDSLVQAQALVVPRRRALLRLIVLIPVPCLVVVPRLVVVLRLVVGAVIVVLRLALVVALVVAGLRDGHVLLALFVHDVRPHPRRRVGDRVVEVVRLVIVVPDALEALVGPLARLSAGHVRAHGALDLDEGVLLRETQLGDHRLRPQACVVFERPRQPMLWRRLRLELGRRRLRRLVHRLVLELGEGLRSDFGF